MLRDTFYLLYGCWGVKEVWIRSFWYGTFELFHVPCRCDEVRDPVQLQLLYVHVVLRGTYQLVRPNVQLVNAFVSYYCTKNLHQIQYNIDPGLNITSRIHWLQQYAKSYSEKFDTASQAKTQFSELCISSLRETIPEYKREKLTYYNTIKLRQLTKILLDVPMQLFRCELHSELFAVGGWSAVPTPY